MPILFWLVSSFVILYLIWFYIVETQKKRKLPPGPPVLPLIGSIPFMAKAHPQPHIALVKLSEKYGDLMRMRLGTHEYVVLSSVKVLHDLLTKDEAVGRPDHGVLKDREEFPNTGIVNAVGEPWKTRRIWMQRTLREMGIGRTSYFEETSRQMISEFHSKLSRDLPKSGLVFEVNRRFPLSPAYIIWRLLVGSQTSEDDRDCDEFLKANDQWLEMGTFGDGLLLVAPFLKFFIPRLTGYAAQMELVKVSRTIAQKLYDRFWKLETDNPQSLFHSYVIEEKKGKSDFFLLDFKLTFNDIMLGAIETSDSYIRSIILFLTLYPDEQERLANEISSTFPPDHVFSIVDLKLLPYTEAFMIEVHRLSMVVTNWVPHTLTGDVTYRGYMLKKGTNLLPNPHAAFKAKDVFGEDADEFRPERFLDKNDKTKLSDIKKLVTPFGIGKRFCPGDSVAQIVSFFILASTVKNFRVSPVPGETPPALSFFCGITSKPLPFKVLVTRRSKV